MNVWDEHSIRAALEGLLADCSEWPTYRWFVRRGAKGLRDAVTSHGGAERWAREMGLAGGDRGRGASPRWTDERIRCVLTPFLTGRESWPMRAEFDQAGLSGLREVLRREGNLDHWASEFGLPRRTRKTSERPRLPRPRAAQRRQAQWPLWTRPRIHEELARFLGEREDWPRFDEFVAAGKKGLYQAVLAHGGSQAWARQMGVVWVDRHAPQWTENRITERLASFLTGRNRWPTEAEFAASGEARLLDAIRRHGGSGRWAAEFGLSASRKQAWSDTRIDHEIGPLVRELNRWPTKTEFRRAGLSKALAAVYTHGGSKRWQARFGVQPLPYSGRVPNRRIWTPARVERELGDFLAGYDRWPGARVFEEAGRGSLYRAAWEHGGIAHWRLRFGYE